MVPTSRSAPAANTPSGTGYQRPDSDLDDYEMEDNLASFRSPDFHPPLFDLDVALSENKIPGLEDSTGTAFSLLGQGVTPFHDGSHATISTTETPPPGSAPVGAPAPCIVVSLADFDSLHGLSTPGEFPFHPTLLRTSALSPSFVHRHRDARRSSLPIFGPIRNQ